MNVRKRNAFSKGTFLQLCATVYKEAVEKQQALEVTSYPRLCLQNLVLWQEDPQNWSFVELFVRILLCLHFCS